MAIHGAPESTVYRVKVEPPRGKTSFDPKYARFETSGLQFTVKPQKNVVELRLDPAR